MRFLSTLSTRISRAVLITVLLATGLVPLAGLIAPAVASAAACTGAPFSGGGGGFSALNLNATATPTDSSVQKIGAEITPHATWGSTDNASVSNIGFADSGCAFLSTNLNMSIAPSRQLSMDFYQLGRTGAFVATTDYDNLFSGVSITGASNNAISEFDYVIPAIAAGTAQLISVDISRTGWIDVYLKTGTGTENRLMSYKAPTGTTSFYNKGSGVNFGYNPIDSSFTSCSQLTGSASIAVRALDLTNATVLGLTAAPTTQGISCPSFDKTSYDSASKVATLAYDVAGASINHVVKDYNNVPALKTTATPLQFLTSLTLGSSGTYFKDGFSTGTSDSQQLYFATQENQDGKVIPKNTPWPIAGGTFNLATGDVDVVGNGVVLDTSPATFAAVAHNMNKITKDGTFTLFVPYKTGDNFVGLCAGAVDLTGVNTKCNGIYYVKDGQTKKHADTNSIPTGHSVKAAIVMIGAKKFWQVDGLTGTGGFSTTLASDPETGISVSTTSTPVVIATIIGTLALAFTARRFADKRK